MAPQLKFRAGAVAAVVALTGCGASHGRATPAKHAVLTSEAQAAAICREAQREIDIVLSHGLSNLSPTVVPTEIPRAARDSVPILTRLLGRLRALARTDPGVRRTLRSTETNRSAVVALARAHALSSNPFRAIFSADAACLTPHISG
jgi:hypothetical protein